MTAKVVNSCVEGKRRPGINPEERGDGGGHEGAEVAVEEAHREPAGADAAGDVGVGVLEEDAAEHRYALVALEVLHLGFGRIVVSEREVPNMLANLV